MQNVLTIIGIGTIAWLIAKLVITISKGRRKNETLNPDYDLDRIGVELSNAAKDRNKPDRVSTRKDV